MKPLNITSVSVKPARFSWSILILTLGFMSSALAWWLIAIPVTTFSSTDKHPDHFALVFLHVMGGTIMLFVGLTNLYIGTTGKQFKYHKIIGRTYLIGGAIGSLAAIIITISPAHKPAGTNLFTNITISLLTLTTAWLLCAGMSYRAVRNGRYDSHRDLIAAMCLPGHSSFAVSPVVCRASKIWAAVWLSSGSRGLLR